MPHAYPLALNSIWLVDRTLLFIFNRSIKSDKYSNKHEIDRVSLICIEPNIILIQSSRSRDINERTGGEEKNDREWLAVGLSALFECLVACYRRVEKKNNTN